MGGDQGKEGEKVEAERGTLQSRWVPAKTPSLGYLPSYFLPSSSCKYQALMSYFLAPSFEKNGAAFRLDSPSSFNGGTAAWRSCTSRLRKVMVTRRRKPANFMVPLEVFGKNAAAGLATAVMYALPPTELKCKARGGTSDCGSPSPAQRLIFLRDAHHVHPGLCHVVA